MSNETQIGIIASLTEAVLETDPTYFLVELRIKPTNNIKLFLDGDHGITIEKCVQINRALYKKIEQSELYPDGNFSLEVSSPGLDEPLKLMRQYKKNIGRPVEVVLVDGTLAEGRLVEVAEESIVVEEKKGKKGPGHQGIRKPELVRQTLSFNNIKTIKIQVVF
jgi:ribosome maturation factor RimP